MSETIKATLVMELNVECPECEEETDLFKTPQNEEGQLYSQVLDDDRWRIHADERLKTHYICPHCSCKIEVKGVIW